MLLACSLVWVWYKLTWAFLAVSIFGNIIKFVGTVLDLTIFLVVAIIFGSQVVIATIIALTII